MRRLTLLTLALLLPLPSPSQPPTPKSPTTLVHDFYNWYLSELNQHREPLTQKPAALRKYVSPALLAGIQRLAKSPDGLDADPFLAAQDFPDDWQGNVTVTPRSPDSVLVTLGKNQHSRNQLIVSLRNERGAWKITKVEPLAK